MKKITRILLIVLALAVLILSASSCTESVETAEHVHTYSDEWSHSRTVHWKASTCGHAVKGEEAEHTFDSGKVENDTHIIYTCSVCEYQLKELHDHEFGNWSVKVPATIFESGEEIRSCKYVDCSGTESREIARIEVESIIIQTMPDKTQYNDGDAFDKTGLKVIAIGKDSSQTDVTALVEFDKTILADSDTEVTVSYAGKTATVLVSVLGVNNHTHTYSGEWQISTPPTIFAGGEKYRVCDFDGCEEKEYADIDAIEISSIRVVSLPTKTVYVAGESFDKAGLVIKAIGADNSETDITALVEFDKTILAEEDTFVTATYAGKSVEIEITVSAPVHVHTYSGEWQVATPPTIFAEGQKYRVCDLESCDEREIATMEIVEVVSINVTAMPTKVEYLSGERFDKTGLVIEAIGADNSKTNVTALVEFDKTVLSYTDTKVTATFRERSCAISILVTHVYTVSEALTDAKDSEKILVEGIYVGVADEGSGFAKELLLKDKNNDNLISVIGVTYGQFPDYGYMKGDLVRIEGTLTREVYDEADKYSQNKIFITFADTNPENIKDTIISHGNTVSFKLTDAVEITSWSQMQEYFTPENVQAYTYVHFTGTVWFNSYSKATDGVPLHRFSMNSSASKLDHIKPDGARAVGFRENVIKANTPALMSGSFADAFGTTTYPGKKTTVDFYAVVTATNNVNYQLTILETNWVAGGAGEAIKIETNQDIVREVAYAYYRQGSQIYYDQTWRATNFSPEEATAQKQLNLDCSSYVNSVYYEAFGYNVLGIPISQKGPTTENFTTYAKENLGKSADVIGYWETADYTDTSVQKQLLLDVQSSLQVGDIIVFRRGKTEATSGHTLIYVGNGKFLHSTGSKCTYSETSPDSSKDVCSKTEYQNGTIGLLNTSELFTNTSSSRYLFKKTDSETIFTFCQIRPLALDLKPTEKTENRVKIAGVDVEKTIAPGVGAAVCRGETVTYTLTVKNYSSNRYTGVKFEEILSDSVEFVSGSDCIRADGQKLSAELTIAGGDYFVISWTVRVKADAKDGARIESKNTTVGGVNIFATENYVSAYTDAELKSVADKAKELAESSTTYTDPIEFAKAIYKEALGVDVFDEESAAALLESILTYYNGGTRYTVNADSEYADITLADISIGRLMSTALHDSTSIVEEDLEVGDLIFCEWTKGQRLFVYVGNNEFVMVDTITKTPTLVSGGEKSYVLTDSSYVLQNLYNSLRSYPKCVVMRPSISTK